ncbi:unnamed protein product, partial [Gulo gulo]
MAFDITFVVLDLTDNCSSSGHLNMYDLSGKNLGLLELERILENKYYNS